MRRLTWLLLVALGGCNWVLGLDAPADTPVDGDVSGDGDMTDADTTDGDDTDAPIDATDPNGRLASMVEAGGNHTCVRRNDGTVRCWGAGNFGQLGLGNTNTIGDDEPANASGDVLLGVPAVAVAAGTDHTCALVDDGDLYCWGSAVRGQLGHANTLNVGDDELPLAAGPVLTGSTSQSVAAGAQHTCAVSLNQTVRCWGAGNDGRLGYGNVNDVGDNETPSSAGNVSVSGSGSVVALAAGTAHTCALKNNGTVNCWGSGVGGPLGYGDGNNIGDNEVPSTVGNVDLGGAVVQVVAGGNHTCALLNNGAVRCWGLNQFGQLGYGNTTTIGDNEVPSAVGDVNVGGVVTQLAAGVNHTCALLDTGTVRCWGLGNSGQLGYGNTNNIGDNETPSIAGDIALGGVAIAITAGAAHTCALFTGGAVMCWGLSVSGQLGYGTQQNVGDDEVPASAGFVPYN